MSAVQVAHCAARIPDPIKRARFVAMLATADALVHQAAEMRRQAWTEYREATGETRRGEYA